MLHSTPAGTVSAPGAPKSTCVWAGIQGIDNAELLVTQLTDRDLHVAAYRGQYDVNLHCAIWYLWCREEDELSIRKALEELTGS